LQTPFQYPIGDYPSPYSIALHRLIPLATLLWPAIAAQAPRPPDYRRGEIHCESNPWYWG